MFSNKIFSENAVSLSPEGGAGLCFVAGPAPGKLLQLFRAFFQSGADLGLYSIKRRLALRKPGSVGDGNLQRPF
jgi:hypothetical protein